MESWYSVKCIHQTIFAGEEGLTDTRIRTWERGVQSLQRPDIVALGRLIHSRGGKEQQWIAFQMFHLIKDQTKPQKMRSFQVRLANYSVERNVHSRRTLLNIRDTNRTRSYGHKSHIWYKLRDAPFQTICDSTSESCTCLNRTRWVTTLRVSNRIDGMY